MRGGEEGAAVPRPVGVLFIHIYIYIYINGMVVNDTTLVSSGSASSYEQTIRSSRTDNAIRVSCKAAGSTAASN